MNVIKEFIINSTIFNEIENILGEHNWNNRISGHAFSWRI